MFCDSNREKNKRGLILSRSGCIAPHRYPILYGGSSEISWKALKELPFKYLSAANIGVSWWSHDVGGFKDGEEDAEGLLSDEFSYVRKVIISASVPVLEAGCITSYGTIVESPDRNGFFLMHSVYSNDDYVCLLLKKKGSPSLYRGKLSEI